LRENQSPVESIQQKSCLKRIRQERRQICLLTFQPSIQPGSYKLLVSRLFPSQEAVNFQFIYPTFLAVIRTTDFNNFLQNETNNSLPLINRRAWHHQKRQSWERRRNCVKSSSVNLVATHHSLTWQRRKVSLTGILRNPRIFFFLWKYILRSTRLQSSTTNQ